ncbi:MAG: hypothetical protein IJ525_05415 [Alphaproteobacteria bacterium]|nr:hypothetical protein [Alphaproteobacteria bacterium]
MRNLEIKNNDSLAPCGKERQSGRSLLPESGVDAPAVLSAVYTDSTPARNRQSDAPQYGRSMIEMLGVLAIIGVLSVGGIAGYSKAMMKYRINKTIEQISLISSNIQSFFAPQKNYSGLNDTVIKKAKLVPDEIIELKTDGTIKLNNEFGGGMSVYNYNNRAFIIALENLPQEACIELVTQNWMDSMTSLIGFGSHNQFVLNDDPFSCTNSGIDTEYYSHYGAWNACPKDIPLGLDFATIVCDSNNYNSLAWSFK